MRSRHNCILQRLAKAVGKEDREVFVEQAFSPDKLSPDLVVVDIGTKKTTIVDVTIPHYEAGQEPFKKTRVEKEPMVHASIVRALGSWDTDNGTCLTAPAVQLPRHRLKLLQALQEAFGHNFSPPI